MLKEKVLEIQHYSDRLFSFKTTRDKSFRFKNGEFCMIGLDVDTKVKGSPLPKKVMRAYSIVSTNYDDHLEFLSIKVPNGPLTSKLQHLEVGDEVLVNPKPTGSLVCDYLYPKDNLILLASLYENQFIMRVAVVGATGMVGTVMLRVLEERKLPNARFWSFGIHPRSSVCRHSIRW